MQKKPTEKNDPEMLKLSPLAKDKTYGEKVYDRIFNVGLNFWLNLLLSGAFTFWVKHYEKPIWGEGTMLGKLGIGKKLSAKGISNLRELHHAKVEQIAESAFMKSDLLKLDTHELRVKRAESVVNVFTLQIPGHAIVIPSVTLGAKYKASIVKYFNRKHYGDEAMESPDLVARHHAIAVGERPTVLGAVVGRIGGMLINMGLGSIIGSENNLLNKAGVKNFKGIDPTAGKIGEEMGHVAGKIAPTAIGKTNKWFLRSGFDKNTSINDLGRFIAQDVMYTISTSRTIYPVVSAARKLLPGMTYKPKHVADTAFDNLPKVNVPKNPLVHAADTPEAEQPIAGALAAKSETHSEAHTAEHADKAHEHAPKATIHKPEHHQRVHQHTHEVATAQ